MSLLSVHLEQISFSCQGIDSLPFPPPKIFTNALLSHTPITSLLRDTEAHERALFSVPPPPPPQIPTKKEVEKQRAAAAAVSAKPSNRRHTVFNVTGGEVTTGPPSTRSGRPPRQHTAVAAVLGGDLHAQIVRRGGRGEEGKGDVAIEVLLRGAEKLCNVYPLPGALERIPAQRNKFAHQSNTLAYYEARIAEQAEALGRMNKEHFFDDEEDEENGDGPVGQTVWTEEELRREEEEVRELEKKKKELQERLRAMDRDLGGLLNM